MPLNMRSFLCSQSNELNTGCLPACSLVSHPTSVFLVSIPNGPSRSGCRLSDIVCARSSSCECKFHDVDFVSVPSTESSLNQLKRIIEEITQKFTKRRYHCTINEVFH